MKTILLSIFAVATFSNAILAQTFKYSFETSEGFTVGDLSGQHPQIYTNGATFVNTDFASDGTQSVKILNDYEALSFHGAPAYNKTSISSDVYVPALGTGALSLEVGDYGVILSNGEIWAQQWFGDFEFEIIASYETGMWYHIEFVMDYSSHTIEILINNVSYYTDALPGNLPTFSTIYFNTLELGNEFYFDNIEVKDSSATLGVSDANAKSKLTVYPNPTSDFINVKSDKKISQITIVDLSGKMVKQTKENLVDVQSLAQGIYIANIKFEDGSSESKKIIKK